MSLNLSSQVAAANALPYGASAFSQGMTAEDYRNLHREHAQRVRWWKAVALPDGAADTVGGKRYFEQTLDESVRAFIFSNTRSLEAPEFGQIVSGDVQFSSLPDEIDLAKGDRILQLDYPKNSESKVRFVSDVATLPRLFVASVDGVYDENGLIDGDDYEVDGREITWVGAGSAPEEVAVRYQFLPQYEFRGEGDRQAFRGMDGERVPQIVPLHLLAEEEEIG